jgi:tetratricopeptide (TPR) repeat protein
MTAEEYRELGFAYLKEKNWGSALQALRESEKRFLEQSTTEQSAGAVPPQVLSALGLCLAMAENRIQDGVQYCQRAINDQAHEAQYHYHLGMVYLKAPNKKKALNSFYHGLKVNPGHPRIKKQLHEMGVRKLPVLSFLPRDHFLNKFFGQLVRSKAKQSVSR